MAADDRRASCGPQMSEESCYTLKIPQSKNNNSTAADTAAA